MKIDVEGHEEKTIKGAEKILRNNKVLIYVETDNRKVINFLKNINFKIYYFNLFEKKIYFSKKKNSSHIICKNF